MILNFIQTIYMQETEIKADLIKFFIDKGYQVDSAIIETDKICQYLFFATLPKNTQPNEQA